MKILGRGGTRPPFTTTDRALLAAAAQLLSRDRWRSFLVRPDTLVRWHREFLRKRRGRRSRPPGRPALDPSIKSLILRLGRENSRWGYLRIRGELLKLGIDVSATTIATVLRRGGLGPAPRRIGPTWRQVPQVAGVRPALPRISVRRARALGRARTGSGPGSTGTEQRRLGHRRGHGCHPRLVASEPSAHVHGGRSTARVRDSGSACCSSSRRARDGRLKPGATRRRD
jgi:hypothetical protein